LNLIQIKVSNLQANAYRIDIKSHSAAKETEMSYQTEVVGEKFFPTITLL
jgi:hypothetical protein